MPLVISRLRKPGLVKFDVSEGVSWVALAAKVALVLLAGYLFLEKWPWYAYATLLAMCLSIRLRMVESLMGVRDLGLQINRRGRIRVWSDSYEFVPINEILDIVINEVVMKFEVKPILQVLIYNADYVKLPFQLFAPRLDDLINIWRCTRSILLTES